jgi:hypothetical protein
MAHASVPSEPCYESKVALRLPPLLTITATFEAPVDQRLPPFIGPALHGALARSLYRLVCAFRQRTQCSGCPIHARCPYPTLFEPRAERPEALAHTGIRNGAPGPLILGPEPAWIPGVPLDLTTGQCFSVRFSLAGRSAAELPFLVSALQAAAKRGLGIAASSDADSDRPRPPLRLRSVVSHGGIAVYDGAEDRFTAAEPEPLDLSAAPEIAVIQWITPLRLKVGGRIASSFDGVEFAVALARRAHALNVLYGQPSPESGEAAVRRLAAELQVKRSTRRVLVRRYSARQKRRMEWPGLMGTVEIAGPTLADLWPLLVWGERAQVGKATSFGFGRYALQSGRSPHAAASTPEPAGEEPL